MRERQSWGEYVICMVYFLVQEGLLNKNITDPVVEVSG